MKSKQALIIIVAGILILAAVLYILLTQLGPSNTQSNRGERFAQHRIVYECKRTSVFTEDNFNICAISADGSGKTELAGGTSIETTYGSPIFNSRGDLLFHCQYFEVGRAGVLHNLCAQRAGQSDVQRLSFPTGVARADLIGLNAGGQVVASCGEKLCVSSLDSQDYTFIPNSDANGQAIGPSINSQGQIAYTCWLLGQVRSREICTIMPDGSGFRILTDSGEGRAFNPQVLDSGLVIYHCGDARDIFDICSIQYDGSMPQQLTTATRTEDNLNPAISAVLGVIVYECWQDVRHAHLCAMNLDGSEQRQLTPDPEHNNPFVYINPSISSDGLVAFGCDKRLCIIELDGTGMIPLTGDATRDFEARRPVIFYGGE